MEIQRHATLRWLSKPPAGRARLSAESGAFTQLPLSVAEGEHPNPGEATPGELLAAAYCAFLAVALAERLVRDGVPATELIVEGTVSIEMESAHRHVSDVDLSVRGRVPELDPATFAATVGDVMGQTATGLGLDRSITATVSAELLGRRHGAVPG
jgi:osmotically inducible protein OsmC